MACNIIKKSKTPGIFFHLYYEHTKEINMCRTKIVYLQKLCGRNTSISEKKSRGANCFGHYCKSKTLSFDERHC